MNHGADESLRFFCAIKKTAGRSGRGIQQGIAVKEFFIAFFAVDDPVFLHIAAFLYGDLCAAVVAMECFGFAGCHAEDHQQNEYCKDNFFHKGYLRGDNNIISHGAGEREEEKRGTE